MKAEAKILMESAVISLYEAEEFCQTRCLTAQKLFLEGEKRRLRYMSGCFHNLIRHLLSDYFDLNCQFLDCTHEEKQLSDINNVSDFFKKTLRYFEDLHDTLHGYANSLIPVLAYRYAKKLLCECDTIAGIIIEYKRIVGEGEKTNWDNVFVQRLMSKQQTDENVHDLYEKKENA